MGSLIRSPISTMELYTEAQKLVAKQGKFCSLDYACNMICSSPQVHGWWTLENWTPSGKRSSLNTILAAIMRFAFALIHHYSDHCSSLETALTMSLHESIHSSQRTRTSYSTTIRGRVPTFLPRLVLERGDGFWPNPARVLGDLISRCSKRLHNGFASLRAVIAIPHCSTLRGHWHPVKVSFTFSTPTDLRAAQRLTINHLRNLWC
jgi:hypothetical protein